MEFALGTAQFGQTYGIRNATGAVTGQAAKDLVNKALYWNINTFDTAQTYGKSEDELGRSLPDNVNAHIVTKYYIDPTNPHQLLKDVEYSQDKLRRRELYAILIHNADVLLSSSAHIVWAMLERLKAENIVKKVGVSFYTPHDFIIVLARYPLEIIQAPLNILDQRFLQTDIQRHVHDAGIEFHARSLFLQGVLLTEPDALPNHFKPYRDTFNTLYNTALRYGLTPLELCLKFATDCSNIGAVDRWIIGADSPAQLERTMQSLAHIGTKGREQIDFAHLATDVEDIVDPRLWSGTD